ncbi:T9SS type A sorting domain-containing protein [candidate division KSB1 bacterium]
MRKRIKYSKLIIIVLFPCVQLFSQGYIPFPTSYAKWTNSIINYDTNFSYLLYVNGDSTINNQLYRKVYGSSDELIDPVNDLCLGGFFEDNNKAIWYRTFDTLLDFDGLSQNGTDYLLYKFGMSVGDSTSCDSGSLFYWKVYSIDSILINSIYHKRYFMDLYYNGYLHYETDCWIEGIGSDRELFYVYNYFTEVGNRQLLCFNDNPIPNSVLPGLPYCFYYVGINENEIKPELKVFPNPSKGHVTFELDNIELPIEIGIYNVLGIKILETEINTKSLNYYFAGKKGIYFYQILSNNTLIYTGKLINE